MPFSQVLEYLEGKGWKLLKISNHKRNRQFVHEATGRLLSVPVVENKVLLPIWRELKGFVEGTTDSMD